MFIPLFQLQLATERLQKINESIDEKSSAREDYDKTIRETEAAYMKVTYRLFNSDVNLDVFPFFVVLNIQILESSQTLLSVLKRESVSLVKKRQVLAVGIYIYIIL